MKRLLLASTALVATAGVASAEYAFSGLARFGIGYIEDRDPANAEQSDTILVSRFQFNFDGSTETDGGVRFGARVRFQADEDATGEADVAKLAGPSFVVEYGGLQVAAGNVGGAIANLNKRSGYEPGLESFVGQASGIDYGFLDSSSTASGDHAAYFKYGVGDFSIAASYDQRTDANGGDRWDVSATYTIGNITAGVAHGQTDAMGDNDPSLTVLTLAGDFGDFKGALVVADDATEDKATDDTAYGLSASYTVGATTFIFAYGDGGAVDDEQKVGIGALHDLGGGASLRGGIGRTDKDSDSSDQMRADFGVHFDF